MEPTVYAVLALLSAGETQAASRGIQWIRRTQRPDGGWAPCAGVDQSTWVTALVGFLPPEHLGEPFYNAAIRWLLHTEGRETTLLFHIRQWLLGSDDAPDRNVPGWPWVPGNAAWVCPTALAVMALQKHQDRRPSANILGRVRKGQKFLLRHTCDGGGWNHGGVNALGYASHAYPETTGMALAALRGVSSPEVATSIELARKFLAQCRSADAINWLRIGLRAHGQLPAGYCPPAELTYRTITETSLEMVLTAVGAGRQVFGV